MKNISLLPIFLFVVLCLTISSCSVNREVLTRQESKTALLAPHSTGMLVKPVIADLEITKERKTINYEADLKLPINDLKDNATRVFLETHKCDYIVDPKFVRTSSSDDGLAKSIEYVLTGYAAVYSKVYQVDSLPKSIVQYAELPLKKETDNFVTSYNRTQKGVSVGIEFATTPIGEDGLYAVQIDYGPNFTGWLEGMRYYFGIEKSGEETFGSVSFDVKRGSMPTTQQTLSFYDPTTISFGVFKEKRIGRAIKIRAAGGFNFLSGNISEDWTEGYYDKIHGLGMRVGAGIDFKIFNGFSWINRFHSNFNLLRFVSKGPNNQSAATFSNVRISDMPLFYPCTGIRFTF